MAIRPRRVAKETLAHELVSLPKAALTNYLGTLSNAKMESLNRSLKVALAIED